MNMTAAQPQPSSMSTAAGVVFAWSASLHAVSSPPIGLIFSSQVQWCGTSSAKYRTGDA